MDYDRRRPAVAAPSLKQRIRSSASSFFCCFHGASDEGDTPPAEASLIRVSSDWIRSRAHEIPELTDRMRSSLASRMGRHGRAGSGGFRYDPLSYALNFDGGDNLGEDEETQPRSFASRLPATPPPPPDGSRTDSRSGSVWTGPTSASFK